MFYVIINWSNLTHTIISKEDKARFGLDFPIKNFYLICLPLELNFSSREGGRERF